METKAKKTILSFKEKGNSNIYKDVLYDKANVTYKWKGGLFQKKEKEYYPIKITSSLKIMQEYLNSLKKYDVMLLDKHNMAILWKNVDKNSIILTQENVTIEVEEVRYWRGHRGGPY